jgi:selenocysteine lyase/cysteine desulfurase
MTSLVVRREFQPAGVYFDSATYGLPPKTALEALVAAVDGWTSGRYDPVSCDQAVGHARSTFARLHGVVAEDVAIGRQVSPMVGLIAASLPPRARVLAAEGDFTSLLFPLLAAGCDVRTIPLERLADAVDSCTDLVAVSAVQSADGRLVDEE